MTTTHLVVGDEQTALERACQHMRCDPIKIVVYDWFLESLAKSEVLPAGRYQRLNPDYK
jgi:hypothetical protein